MNSIGPKTRIYLIRHGQVEGHEVRRYNSQANVPLTPKGVSQYRELLRRLTDVNIRACYTSDLTRCVIGAEIFAEYFQVEVIKRKELREINVGIWTGMDKKDIMKIYPEEWRMRHEDLLNYRVKEGENLLDVSSRINPVIQEVVQKHVGEEVIIVGHGGVNRLILLSAMQAPLTSLERIEQNYASLNIIDYYENGHAIVRTING